MSSEKPPPLDWRLGKLRGIFLFEVFLWEHCESCHPEAAGPWSCMKTN